ncbi:MAG TPA: aminotransferase class I/II-fold pyridoxal phosphate-dependent enzyme [Firmicutes bacterium]|nr:aminotransferase class I/II-fold pyridoxal phosphate-dependent enzyme [Bacillota bacterium]
MIEPARRTLEMKYAVRDVLCYAEEAKKAGLELLYLNIGDPNKFDFVTPRHMIEAVYKAMLANENGYAPSSGVQEARDAIEKEAHRKGLKNIHDIFVTSGVSECIELCLTALVNVGEEVMTPSPSYPIYDSVCTKLEAVNVPYYLDEDNNWNPDIEYIKSKITPKTRALVLINPNNPTGSIASLDVLKELIEISIKHNIVIFSDEIYDKQTFDGKTHTSIASLTDEAPIITMNGLSKNYLVPGFRIGWGMVTGNKQVVGTYVEAINKFLRARLCAPAPLMFAIKPALEGPQDHLKEMVEKLQRRRDITWERLNAIPRISCTKPEAAFYCFPKLDIEESDFDWLVGLIRTTGVVAVHGSGFGQKPGTKHIRIVFLPPEDILDRAFTHIENYMKKTAGVTG